MFAIASSKTTFYCARVWKNFTPGVLWHSQYCHCHLMTMNAVNVCKSTKKYMITFAAARVPDSTQPRNWDSELAFSSLAPCAIIWMLTHEIHPKFNAKITVNACLCCWSMWQISCNKSLFGSLYNDLSGWICERKHIAFLDKKCKILQNTI